MEEIYAISSIINGQCGIGTIAGLIRRKYLTERKTEAGEFYLIDKYFRVCTPLKSLITKDHKGGSKFVGTGFINDDICKEAYFLMCEQARLVFQTPVRLNTNSKNYFFYAMFDNLNTPEEDGYLPTIQPNWPF